MPSHINTALMRLSRRAEANDPATLVRTFVDVGSMFTLLSSSDHQVIYGRRGTGKTHALHFLAGSVRAEGDIAVYIDMRTIGSSGGLYADPNVPFTERGTRLLSDTFAEIYNALAGEVLSASYANDHDFTMAMRHIDALGDSLTDIRVAGDEEHEVTAQLGRDSKDSAGVELGLGPKEVKVGVRGASESTERESLEVRTLRRGPLRQRVHFGAIAGSLQGAVEALPGRLWVLLDEWSDVPLDLQPLLGDLLRRCLMPARGVTMKIGAIEQRSNFKQDDGVGGYLGLELGADIAADVDLDDFMVFGNNAGQAKAFFKELLYKHVTAVLPSEAKPVPSSDEFVRQAFTQRTAFDEFVRAAEGVPRDAINIGAVAAQHAGDAPISVPLLRTAARRWYLRDKEKAVESNPDAIALLHWVIDEVIAGRKARAFLLRQGEASNHPLIGALYDSRVLHVIKRGVAAHDQPGVRFNVYGLDYGCYVEMISTAYEPQGLLPGMDDDDTPIHVDVPPDDYRSIRRAILDLSVFQQKRQASAPMAAK